MQIGFAKLRKILEKWGHVHGFLVVIVVSDSSMQKSYKSEQILQINFLSNAEKKLPCTWSLSVNLITIVIQRKNKKTFCLGLRPASLLPCQLSANEFASIRHGINAGTSCWQNSIKILHCVTEKKHSASLHSIKSHADRNLNCRLFQSSRVRYGLGGGSMFGCFWMRTDIHKVSPYGW